MLRSVFVNFVSGSITRRVATGGRWSQISFISEST
jgi:hypothetical protein